jgi:hypothetical protein
MSIREVITKFFSLFIEIPPRNKSAIRPAGARAPLPVPDQPLDLPGVYRQFKVPDVQFTAEQALDLIESIPPDRNPNARRQMARGMLNALGKSTGVGLRDVAADASAKIAALHGHAQEIDRQSAEHIQRWEAEIAAMQAQIDLKVQTITSERAKCAQLMSQCQEESSRLNKVVDYFGGDSQQAANID